MKWFTAVGGGLAIDTAKYVASANELPLIAIPTILSTDAFLTDATGVRENGCVQYLPTKTPDTVIVDMDMLCNAPAAMRASGAADILSIATALWDWQEAEKMGENPSESTDHTAGSCYRGNPSPDALGKRTRDRQRDT